MDDQRIYFFFCLFHAVQTGSGAQPTSCLAGTRSVHEFKRPGSVVHHLYISSTEVKNSWSYTSTPLYNLIAWRVIKHRHNSALPKKINNPCSQFGVVKHRIH
jgi:hypothetical protein